jgi:SAM-dependent methyltransferase
MDPVRQLGEVLERAGYDGEGLLRLFRGLERQQARALREARALEAPGELGTLTDLFYLGLPADERAVRRAVAPALPSVLVDSGLLERVEEGFSSSLQITPWLDLLLAHDPSDGGPLDRGHVLGGNAAAETLARATIRKHVSSTLDLGAGCGSQSLLAARHSERVVAVDINARALFYVELNTRLNGVENVECREGDFFEPVDGEHFDLVVANPPYVISPDDELLFRDSGDEAGGVSRRLVRRLPDVLADGGFGHVLCNWPVGAGQNCWEPVEEWTDGLGCDVCVLNWGAEDLVRYASRWTRPVADERQAAAATARWLEYYERAGIDSIWFGEIVVRRSRPDAAGWFRGFTLREQTSGSAGNHLERLFAARDFLTSTRTALLDEILTPAASHSLMHELASGDAEYRVERIEVKLAEGLGLRGELEPLAVHVFMLLDGKRTLAELVDRAAGEHGVSPELLAEVTERAMRRLFEDGLVVRVERS